jgi:CheY-like chemotaxis protein
MGLVGRLEDLPLSDIIQIVHLSRRTGSLHIETGSGKYGILFQKGMIVLAQSASLPDLGAYLRRAGVLPPDRLDRAAEMLASMPGTVFGDLLVEMQFISPADLASAVFKGILEVLDPLLLDTEGIFSFALKETFHPGELGYRPEALFKAGGLPPSSIVHKGQEISVLKDIQDSLARGKEMVRGSDFPGPAAPPPPAIPAFAPPGPPPPPPEPEKPIHKLIPVEVDIVPSARATEEKVLSRFSILSKEEDEGLAGLDILVLEGDPLLRVAMKRMFTKHGFRVTHYNSAGPFEEKCREVQREADYSVQIVGVSSTLPYDEADRLAENIKNRGANTLVMVLHPEYRLDRQHAAALRGADLVLLKPDLLRLSAAEAERSLHLFSEQLYLAVQKYLRNRPELAETRKFHDIAGKEKLNRSFHLLKQLIEELAEPGDFGQICLMILRVAAEYLERGVLILNDRSAFVGLGGFGLTGDDRSMNLRVRSVNLPAEGDSIFAQVLETRKAHRGKLRRTPLNENFITALGRVYPNEIIVIPVAAQKRVLGFLYGDNAEFRRPLGNTDGLEIFLAQAGPVFETALRHHFDQQKVGHGS